MTARTVAWWVAVLALTAVTAWYALEAPTDPPTRTVPISTPTREVTR